MRSQSYLARCDRKECKTVIEVEGSTIAPEGWIKIQVEIDGKWDAVSALEFCSSKCVSIWGKNRGSYQNGTNPRPNGSSREIITAAIDLQEGGEFDYRMISEIIEDSGITNNALRQMLSTLTDDGILEIVKKGKPGTGERTIYKVSDKVTA